MSYVMLCLMFIMPIGFVFVCLGFVVSRVCLSRLILLEYQLMTVLLNYFKLPKKWSKEKLPLPWKFKKCTCTLTARNWLWDVWSMWLQEIMQIHAESLIARPAFFLSQIQCPPSLPYYFLIYLFGFLVHTKAPL